MEVEVEVEGMPVEFIPKQLLTARGIRLKQHTVAEEEKIFSFMIKQVFAAGDEVTLPGYAGTGFKFENKKPAAIFSALLPYIYVVAGLILLFILIIGGIGLMTAAGDPKKIEASQGKITTGVIGFMIIFVSYFLVQLVELMLGIKVL